MAFKFKNGKAVRDRVTGFSGIIVSRCDYLFDKPSYCVQPAGCHTETAKPLESAWFNGARMEPIGEHELDVKL